MSNTAGTLEQLALKLADILRPLGTHLQQANAAAFFRDLGIVVPGNTIGTIANDLKQVITKVDALIDRSTELLDAITAEDAAAIISKGKDIIPLITGLINSLTSIKTALDNLQIPNVNDLPLNAVNLLLVRYLEQVPGLLAALEFTNVLTLTIHNPGSENEQQPEYTTYNFNLNKLAAWLGNAGKEFKNTYGWGDGNFDGKLLFSRLSQILANINMPAYYEEVASLGKLDMGVLEASVKTDVQPRGILLNTYMGFNTGAQQITDGDWKVNTKVEASLPGEFGLLIQPNGNINIIPASPNGAIQGAVSADVTGKKVNGQPFLLIGQTSGSRFEIGEVTIASGAQLSWNQAQKKASGNFRLEANIKKCKIVIDLGSADGFLKDILPVEKITTEFDLKAGVSSETGFYIAGSSALEIDLPCHFQIGPVAFEGLSIAISPKDGKIPVAIGADIKAALGPITIAVQDMGATAAFSFPPSRNGNLGPLQLDIGFKPPKGVGLSIDAGIVKGGGFLLLDADKGEYAGALELSIKDTLQVAAIGIINTKMPDGSKGFSLLVIISATFTPGIALGMGFFLGGLGGMLGIHRTIHVQALQDGVRNNSIGHILFPKDVVANMNTLLPQIKAIFPVQKDQFFIGLMARITWGVPTLVSLDFGLAIEFSNPVRLVILGVLKVVLPTEDAAILRLQVNFIGVIDFDKQYLAFDASLYNSRILTFALGGDMALRLSWGANKAFLMSVGGFHPAFRPPQELRVPNLKRLTLTIMSGNPNLVLTAYFAVTSNTVQFGAKIDFRYKVSKFSVVGYLLFDVLFQFSPFKFIARIAAGLAVKLGSSTILSIDLDFTLSGPTPWNARGTASFSILFFSVKVRLNVTWGESQNVIEPSIPVLPRIVEALNLDANWSAELPPNRANLVTPGKITPAAGEIILLPYGSLKVSQTILPLKMEIQRFGNNKPQDLKNADITAFTLGGVAMQLEEVKESFVPSAFKNLSDNDKLKSPSYTHEKGGVKGVDTSTRLSMNYGVNREVQYEVKVSDLDRYDGDDFEIDIEMFKLMALGGAVSKSPLSRENKEKQFKAVNAADLFDEKFVLVDNATLTQYAPIDFAGGTRAAADDALNALLHADPALKGRISVAPLYDLV